MLSPYRSSVSSLRTLLRSASGQQTHGQQVRQAKRRPSSSLPAPPVSSASTSRLSLPSSRRDIHCSPANRTETRTDQTSGEEANVPVFNVRLTPKAAQDIEHVQAWLGSAFPTLKFPDDVALQMITHESWDHGVSSGHNRRLGFLGRRAMKFYLSLFLTRHADGAMLSSEKIDDLLHTSKLGDSVGRSLKLAEVMRWTPAVNDGQQGPKETGLYKIRGVTVEALLGAIYHQHGAQVARGFFSSRILPFLATFSEKEAETFKAAIASEMRSGEAVLGSLTGAAISAEKTLGGQAAIEEELVEAGEGSDAGTSNGHAATRTAVPLTNARRRRGSSSPSTGLPLEEEATARRVEGQPGS